MTATIHHIDPHCCFASVDDVSLAIWRGPSTLNRVATQRAVLDGLLRRYDKIYALTGFRVVDMGMRVVPDESVRPEFEKLVKLVDGKLIAHALVIEGEGFIASMVRSSAISLSFLFRSKRVISRTFDQAVPGGEWLATAPEGGEVIGQRNEIASTLRLMNARLDAFGAANALAR